LIETPTVWVHGHHPFTEEQVCEIEKRVSALDEVERIEFYRMENVYKDDQASAAAGIFMTNSFDMTNSPNGDCCAMYLAIARLNHSCEPNVQQTHIPETGEEVLVACTTIEVGEEINDCYIELRQSREKRRAALRELYRFDCCCSACACSSVGDIVECSCKGTNGAVEDTASRTSIVTITHEEDDKLRTRAGSLENSIMLAAEDDPYMALDIAKQYVSLLMSQKASKWSTRYIADAYMYLYQLGCALGNRKLAKESLVTAHTMNTALQTDRSPDSLRTSSLLREI
jgi:hypothetical protein